MKIAEIVR